MKFLYCLQAPHPVSQRTQGSIYVFLIFVDSLPVADWKSIVWNRFLVNKAHDFEI